MLDNIWDEVLSNITEEPPKPVQSNICDSNVYLIITDLHLSYKNKNSRVDYVKETQYCVDKINQIIDSYISRGNIVSLLFLGDFTDCSFKDQSKAIEVNNLVVDFKKRVKECYFVIGNHETTYYRDNPLWSLFNKIESESLNQVIKKSCKPQGILPLGRVVDELIDGNVRFLFNHYDTPIQIANSDSMINIGLFHKDILCNAIINDSKVNHNKRLFAENTIHFDENNVFKNYNYAFMGHLHSVYGCWDFIDDITGNKTVVNYLASLGRTNHTEVSNDFLERNIPAVVIKDGEFDCIEDNLFNLLPREECVIEEIVEKQKEIRESSKESKEVLEYFSPNDDDPIDNIKNFLGKEPFLKNLFEEYLNDNNSEVEINIKQRLEDVKWL